MNTPIQLIAGLGNPGIDYANTRHNAGAWFVEALINSAQVTLKAEAKLQGYTALLPAHLGNCRVIVPATFMNHSGRAVAAMSQYYKIPANAILVVYDELDLDPGIVRLKIGGGHGGHNGVRDIIQSLATPEFARARIGIGHPGPKQNVSNYVLGRPSLVEHDKIQLAIDNLLAVIPTILEGQIAAAMKTLHTTSE